MARSRLRGLEICQESRCLSSIALQTYKMIIEQAFFALPELLLGNFYAVQDYEAGIVGVFSMAILQELNGRNVNHPNRHLQAEHRYSPNLSRRADLYVNLRRLMVTNRRLGNYGWRHYNWIEAKFYRNKSDAQWHATNKSTNQGQLIADLIRLKCLVPLTLGNQDSNDRYFLHLYDDEPQYYLPYQDRPWVKALHQAGRQDIVINQLLQESPTAKRQFGEGLENIQIQATVTNLVNYPVTTPVNEMHYWCILTRFDAFSVTLGERWFQIHSNRVTQESAAGAHTAIVQHVSDDLGAVKPTEKPEAPAGDIQTEEPNSPEENVALEEPDGPDSDLKLRGSKTL